MARQAFRSSKLQTIRSREHPLRVTFDTNTLADVVAPESSQRSNGAADGAKVRSAIRAGIVQGFFCETMITLEGIKNVDRTTVFGSTTTNTRFEYGVASDGNGVTYINMRAEQTARQPLDQRQADRFLAAFQLGMKLLGAPASAWSDSMIQTAAAISLKLMRTKLGVVLSDTATL